jgi:hypothetical protein
MTFDPRHRQREREREFDKFFYTLLFMPFVIYLVKSWLF